MRWLYLWLNRSWNSICDSGTIETLLCALWDADGTLLNILWIISMTGHWYSWKLTYASVAHSLLQNMGSNWVRIRRDNWRSGDNVHMAASMRQCIDRIPNIDNWRWTAPSSEADNSILWTKIFSLVSSSPLIHPVSSCLFNYRSVVPGRWIALLTVFFHSK